MNGVATLAAGANHHSLRNVRVLADDVRLLLPKLKPGSIDRVTALTAGHQLGAGFDLTLDLGLAVQNMSIGSEAQGGALTYIGPALQPRVGGVDDRDADFDVFALIASETDHLPLAEQRPLWSSAGWSSVPVARS